MGQLLKPAIIATLTATFMMILSYSYLYSQEKERSLKYFSFAWIVYSARFIVILLDIYFSIPLVAESVVFLSNLLNCGLLVIGIGIFFTKSDKSTVLLLVLISLFIIVVLEVSGLSSFLKTTIVFFISGSAYIYIGLLLLNFKNKNTIYKILGINFILWGVHKYDYPFFYGSEVFAPIGYLLAVVFSIISAQGFIILYYQIKKEELKKDENRLSSLLEVIEVPNMAELYEKALDIALRITESRYGYICRYSEENEELVVNAWSKGVYEDCKVINKQEIFRLSETGCWGEVIRKKKDFIINNYETDVNYKKGLPEGHVQIKKFMTVPFFSGNKIVAVIGVANKNEDYNAVDVRQLTLLMNNVWKIVEIKNYEARLEEAKRKAEESSELKSAFLANISHELRTPLNGILGMLSIIKHGNPPAELSTFVDMAYDSAENMLSLVEEILSFTRTSNNQKQHLKITKFDLIDNLKRVIEIQKITAEKNGLKLFLKTEFYQYEIETDKYKFNQIIVNLIGNAVKFSNEGEIVISVYEEKNLIIEVRDHGMGISADKFDLIFEPFYQLEDPYTKRHKGIGAGLAIVKSLCELLNFEITVDSKVGTGSIFKLVICDIMKE